MKEMFFNFCALSLCMAVYDVASFRACKQAAPFTSFYEQKFKEPEDTKPGTVIIAWKMPDKIKEIVQHGDNFFKTIIIKSYEYETWPYFTAVTITHDPIFNQKTQAEVIDRYIEQLKVIEPYINEHDIMLKIVVEYEAKTIEADQQDYYDTTLKHNALAFQERLNKRLMKEGLNAAHFTFKKLAQSGEQKKNYVSTIIKMRHQINITIEHQEKYASHRKKNAENF